MKTIQKLNTDLKNAAGGHIMKDTQEERFMLKIENLTKVYGDKKAVDELSLHIRPGEIYGFIGHNGAEKQLRSNP